MKIVCDACSAKYSIADEKVRGKVFKIRCKKCSNIIVVRGGGEGQPQQFEQKDTRVFDYSGYDSPPDAAASGGAADAIWHVVIDQEQVGPLSAADVADRFGRGEIDADTYVWREGFPDWERLANVPDFADVAAGAGAAPPAAEDPAAAMFGGPAMDESNTAQSDPADLFAAATADAGATDDPGADLFGSDGLGGGMAAAGAEAQPSDELFGAGGGAAAVAAEAGQPTDEHGQPLTGQRNENSVLFSLNNLASLASDAPKAPSPAGGGAAAAAPQAAPGGGGGGGGGGGATEGSGLIDIRSMAQVYLGDKKGGEAAAPQTGSADDLPVFSQTSFESASPVLMPTAQPSGNNRLLIALISLIGVLTVAAIALVIVVLTGDDDEGERVAANDESGELDTASASGGGGEGIAAENPFGGGGAEEEGEGAGEAAAAADEGDGDAADEPPGEEKDEGGEEVAAAKSKPDRSQRKRDRDKKRKSSSRTRKSSSSSGGGSKSAAKPESSPPSGGGGGGGGGGCDEVTCLVEPNKPCCRKYNKKSSSSGGGGGGSSSNLPERLSRSDISRGISRVRGRVASCGPKHNFKGKVTARIKISGSGRVSSVGASGGNSGVEACVKRAVRQARFKKTQKGMTVNYPFIIR